MKYRVMVACDIYCEDWKKPHETLQTNDPVEAIRKSQVYRDENHMSWVEEIND